ncbi:MAG: hypothetical protein EPN43_06375 [Jatrophihabitans sp.]|nr:MAG: hypothetical protein EPN43_06375 [Jatrophihabitans sp.]
MPNDARARSTYRIPASDLAAGDLVDTGGEDWQQVVGVYLTPESAPAGEVHDLVAQVSPRYVVAQLTDINAVDSEVVFRDGSAVLIDEDGDDQPLDSQISAQDGLRTYLYTRYELVTVRAS